MQYLGRWGASWDVLVGLHLPINGIAGRFGLHVIRVGGSTPDDGIGAGSEGVLQQAVVASHRTIQDVVVH